LEKVQELAPDKGAGWAVALESAVALASESGDHREGHRRGDRQDETRSQ
jgi:hypothetical protein